MALETVLKTLVTKVKARQKGLAQAVFNIPELRVYLLQGMDGIRAKTISLAFLYAKRRALPTANMTTYQCTHLFLPCGLIN